MENEKEEDAPTGVMFTGEENYVDESDFYYICWSDTEQCVKKIYYGSWTYGCKINPKINITPEQEEKAREWAKPIFKEAYKRQCLNEAKQIQDKDEVIVKTPYSRYSGLKGRVFWIGHARNPRYFNKLTLRVGVLLDDGKKAFFEPYELEVTEEYWSARMESEQSINDFVIRKTTNNIAGVCRVLLASGSCIVV